MDSEDEQMELDAPITTFTGHRVSVSSDAKRLRKDDETFLHDKFENGLFNP
jgi:hypothetical protein